jgi:multidrug efflux system outer membrane protein
MHKQWLILVASAVVLLTGCGAMEPTLPVTETGIPADWPLQPASPGSARPADAPAQAPANDVAEIGWREFFDDPALEQLIGLALENNRDLRAALLNVERARALYRIERADRLPSLDATATMMRAGSNNAFVQNRTYSAELGVAAYELDLFGRVHNLGQAALRDYLAQAEAARSARLSLVAEVANAWLTLQADLELQRIAQAALANREEELALTGKRFELGAASRLEVSQSKIELETARADLWQFTGQVARDINALRLMTGTHLQRELLSGPVDMQVTGLGALPPGTPSEVLLRRPDVVQAEYTLRAENANVGAARAAFFPSIALTGSVGTASNELTDLFGSGTDVWAFMPQINLPIFQGGRLRGNLDASKADRDIALAGYERSIQSAFREVADALALTRTLAEQIASREALLKAAENADELSRRRYEAGSDSYLVRLDSQRTLYTAQQALVSTLLAQQANRVTLYKVLGGGWQ